METVEKWLKSLRLHKYNHLFRSLTYEEMLSINEQFLIDLDITKGARNKILVSVRKLNLRHDRLVNMEDDLNQDNISMKEALTVMKEMLITPIPRPLDDGAPSPAISLPESSSSPSSITSSVGGSSSGCSLSGYDNTDAYSLTSGGSTPSPTTPSIFTTNIDSPFGSLSSSAATAGSAAASAADAMRMANKTATLASNSYFNNTMTNLYDLTYLFVETFEKLAQRLIDSGGFEDNACHGIMAAIVDECSKHNSFTKEQKARLARFRQPIMRDHMAKNARYGAHSIIKEQKVRMVGGAGYRQQHHHNNSAIGNNNHYHNHHNQPQHPFMRQSHQQQLPQKIQPIQQQTQPHKAQHYNQQLPYPKHQYHQLQQPQQHHRRNVNIYNQNLSAPYREYSLLGPGLTFELPCLRAKAEAEKHNRLQSGFSPLAAT